MLLRLTQPSDEAIAKLLARSADEPYSYVEVGETKRLMPRMSQSKSGGSASIGTPNAPSLEGHWGWHVPDRGEFRGYRLDGASAVLGSGDELFERGCRAIAAWRMFELGWVRLHGLEQAPAPGVTVAVVARVLGLWSVNVARVVYVIDEPDRFGFAYGTLPVHAERGEELFAVARTPDGEVTYEIRVFSRPQQWWSRLGKPVVAARQARFREDSCAAMTRAVASASP